MTRYVASATRQEDERTATPVQTAGNAAIKDNALVRHRKLWQEGNGRNNTVLRHMQQEYYREQAVAYAIMPEDIGSCLATT